MGSLQRFDLDRIIKEYQTPNFFETGTFWGDGVAYALKSPFSKIVSVEIIPEIAGKARQRFGGEKKVEIIETDSISALEKQLPLMKGNIVFWLDAHFPGADAQLENYDVGDDDVYRLPLNKELNVICRLRKKFQDVLILDDLRIYEDGPFQNGPVPLDAMPKSNRNINFVYECYGKTHHIFKSYLDEGYLLLFPKRKYNRNHFQWGNLFKKKPATEDFYLKEIIKEPEPRLWPTGLVNDTGRRKSELCKTKDLKAAWHQRWSSEYKEAVRLHRKHWEFSFILQSLWERGCIAENKNGLVFAVGTEPLPALLANYGCNITATDIHPEKGIEKGWDHGNQLCFGVESLNTKGICKDDIFNKRVKYKAVDMNQIPGDLTGFDFNWSSCSFEHLGSLEKGFSFLKNQLKTLKPGGWAVHTTEYNISSNDETLENENTVIYRQRDIDHIVSELRKEGHFVEELDYSLGGLEEDFLVDICPHTQDPHVKLQLDKYVVTSIGLIIQKKAE